MNRILYIIPILLLAVSCKEDTLKVYNGDNYIHFTPGINDKVEPEYNFALDGMTTRETEASIPVEVRLWGYLPLEDFKYNVGVDDKTTAVESDYINPGHGVFRAGYHVDTLWVTVKRRQELLSTDYKVVINMKDAEDGFVVAPAKYTQVTVTVKDELPNEPVWWGTPQDMGDYSPVKYRLLNIYLGKVLADLDGYTNITFKAEALRFKNWWKENWASYTYYDADGTTPLYETIPE